MSADAVTGRSALRMFLVFAFAYFFAALLRAVPATLAPALAAELQLGAADLGLLAGAFFLGFAALQLPLGSALDRVGPRRVLLSLLGVAVLGCAGFASARDFGSLLLARLLCGVGVSACLMAPMTAYRHSFAPDTQLRANSWMLMTGSLGMLASTLPVQTLLPLIGWRGLFALLAALLLLAMALLWSCLPAARPAAATGPAAGPAHGAGGGYREVFAHPGFRAMLPLGLVQYGGLLAVQSLWAGPWLTEVCGWSREAAARGLFAINLAMLLAFLCWGLLVPRLYARGWTAVRLLRLGLPAAWLALLLALALGARSGVWAWVGFCVCSSVVSLSQPALGQVFASSLAGRALSAFNLVIFAGVFIIQWGLGLLIDALRWRGLGTEAAYQGAFGVLALAALGAYLWFVRHAGAAEG